MPEEADEEFDDVVVVDKPICNQIEEFAKAQEIDLGKFVWHLWLKKKSLKVQIK